MLTQEHFQCWLELMPMELSALLTSIPGPLAAKLDFSVESLVDFEGWLLSRYESIAQILAEDEKDVLDRSGRYVGETMIRQLGGKWEIDLDHEKKAYYRIPVVRTERNFIECPVTLVTASLDRRQGNFIMKVVRHWAAAVPLRRQG